ncbi:hypothetical protein [Paraburkholderia rhizosphaerae]|uniref:Serine protease autotransporter n=1 Tax=Paraburkholderia rhizosphaerae TaxID=480658 RepID=A0A4R8LJH2_9BURK|nr:hypothetical protein [Paraburkholderia rhizosphaerae]TDY43876.1 hypothetical protein BX592_11778 [Paraburkholderia rhizosphaerae]
MNVSRKKALLGVLLAVCSGSAIAQAGGTGGGSGAAAVPNGSNQSGKPRMSGGSHDSINAPSTSAGVGSGPPNGTRLGHSNSSNYQQGGDSQNDGQRNGSQQ